MKRLRLYRIDQKTRDKYAEVFLKKEDFIMPYFVIEGNNKKNEIKNFYDVYHYSIDRLLVEIESLLNLKINKILLFGVIDKKDKDEIGSYALKENGIIPLAIKSIKERFKNNIIIFTDLCLCNYTSHGHCGLLKNNEILNDETLNILKEIATLYAEKGTDFICPSGMMDGQVKTIREALDKNGFKNTKILSYSTKYSSNYYGPFREALSSTPTFGDRKSYQLDYRTIWQGIEETKIDIKEGAYWVMVKPAIHYLDMIKRVKEKFKKVPLVAYHVSGEYISIKLLSKIGLIDEYNGFLEDFIAIKRAGANYIISYYVKDFFEKG